MRKYPKGLEPRKTIGDRLAHLICFAMITAALAWMAVQQFGPAFEVAVK